MIDSEGDLVRFASRVREQYRRDAAFFADHRLPEYAALDDVDGTERERALFCTLGLVPYHDAQDGSPKPLTGRAGLWRVCANVYRRHEWAFSPERLVREERKGDLADVFSRLEIMDRYDAEWWYETARTLLDEFQGDPLRLVAECSGVAPWIARTVRSHAVPGLAGDVATPLWVRMVDEQFRELAWLSEVSMPVDRPIFEVTCRLGDLDLAYDDREHRQLVGSYWDVVGRKHGIAPLSVEPALRALGLFWEDGGRAHAEAVLATVEE